MQYIGFAYTPGGRGLYDMAAVDDDGALCQTACFPGSAGPPPALLAGDGVTVWANSSWLKPVRVVAVQSLLAKQGYPTGKAALRGLADRLGLRLPEGDTAADRAEVVRQFARAMNANSLPPAPPEPIPTELLVGRAVALDCEMTGNEPQRLIEVGAVEMVDGRPTGRTFHARVKPPTPISPFATKVHGLTAEDLAGEPEAAAVLPALLAFIDAAPLVCHEARCDRDVLGRELALAGLPPLADHIHCTAILSRRINHRQPMGLNALCDRFHIDRSVRVHHGALTDAALLAQVLPALIAETTALA